MVRTSYIPKRTKAENRIARIASILRFGTGLLMATVVLVLILIIASLIVSPTASSGSLVSHFDTTDFNFKFEPEDLTGSSKLFAGAIFTIHMLWALYCVSRIHHLFGNFKSKKVFVYQNTKLLRHLGYALIAAPLFWWIAIGSFLLVNSTPTEVISHIKVFSLDGDLIVKVLMIGSIFLSAWVLEIGRELYNDAEYTI